MTFVAAKRFDDRIVIASDTMISDLNGTSSDALPGRLKIITLTPKVTIAFAGLLDQSIDSIREAKSLLLQGSPLSHVEKALSEATARYSFHGEGLEYILISHLEGVTLKRIWEGTISGNLDQTCIGDRDLFSTLLERESCGPLPIVPFRRENESRFSHAFMQLFDGTFVSKKVGGIPIIVNCFPQGHHYSGHAAALAWDKIEGGKIVSQQQLADQKCGMTHWAYSIHAPSLSGIGVVGCFIPDAGIGYIYSPLRTDKPLDWRPPLPIRHYQQGEMHSLFQQAINSEAAAVGGGIEVKYLPFDKRVPSELELAQVQAYAASAPLPTRVQLVESGVELLCGTPQLGQSVLADFYSLNPDPVSVLKTAIDRINSSIAGK